MKNSIGEDVITNLYSKNEGGALTPTDVEKLESTLGEGFAKNWMNMTDAEKEAYNKNNFSQGIKDAW
jgi:hypothetical protein